MTICFGVERGRGICARACRIGSDERIPFGAEVSGHRRDYLCSRDVVRKLIRGREKKTFEAGRAGSEIANWSCVLRGGEKSVTRDESILIEERGDLQRVEAFGNGDGNCEDAAGSDGVENFEGGFAVIKKIFASFERFIGMAAREKQKRIAAADYAVIGEKAGDAADGGALGNVDEDAIREMRNFRREHRGQ